MPGFNHNKTSLKVRQSRALNLSYLVEKIIYTELYIHSTVRPRKSTSNTINTTTS